MESIKTAAQMLNSLPRPISERFDPNDCDAGLTTALLHRSSTLIQGLPFHTLENMFHSMSQLGYTEK